jgi:hypothetical protein
MSGGVPSQLEQFRNIVFADPALQQELWCAPDRASFVRLVVERGRQHGCALDPAMVEAALADASRAWLMRRWIAL